MDPVRTSTPAGCELRRAADTDVPLAALQPLVERIFGARDRPPDWFRRKLAREGADPARSFLAFGPGEQVVGYLLFGDEPGEPIAHCAGLGVLPEYQGRGLGPAMMARAVASLRAAGLVGLRALSEAPRRGFYERVGFSVGRELQTLQAHATGVDDLDFAAHPPAPWAQPGRAVTGWRAGTWSRTPTALAATLTLADGLATAHLSREGRAILVQRLCVVGDDDAVIARTTLRALEQLRGRFVRGAALLLYGCDPVSCVTASLRSTDACWSAVQTAHELDLRLGEGVDKHAAPAA